MYLGTLQEQLLYPHVERTDVSPAALRGALQNVNLGYLVDRYSLNQTQEWTNILSLGEQQRINFARLMMRPSLSLALLDEGTSACDPANEAYLYEMLARRKHSYVSVGHRPALRQFHAHALWLSKPEAGEAAALSGLPSGASEPAVASFLLMKDFEKVYSA